MKHTIAIVVTYNRKILLKECIDSLINQTKKLWKIIIIDNASTDGTYDYISSYLNDQVTYVNTGSNLGGAGGFSFGIKEAMKYDPQYIWLMDDDTISYENTYSSFSKSAEYLKDNFGFLSSKVIWNDKTLCNMNKQKISKNWMNYLENVENNLINIESGSFVSCFINSKVVYDIGLPIKEFFIWLDDAEYTSRISKKYPSFLDVSSVVMHKCADNQTLGIEKSSTNRIPRFKNLYRNRFYRLRKDGIIGVVKFFAKDVRDIYRVIRYSKKSKLKRIHYILYGTLCGLFFFPKIEYLEIKNEKK